MTIPPKVAQGFLDLDLEPGDLTDRTGADYEPTWGAGVDPAAAGLHTLWDVGNPLAACMNELEGDDLDALMNLAGWNSFSADQAQMDAHVRDVLG